MKCKMKIFVGRHMIAHGTLEFDDNTVKKTLPSPQNVIASPMTLEKETVELAIELEQTINTGNRMRCHVEMDDNE